MELNYIDIHSHLNIEPLLSNASDIISNLRENKIGTITVGVDYDTSVTAVELANKNPDILWATVGQHPNDNPDEDFDYDKYKELAQNKKVVAIGECGIDYYRLKVVDGRAIEDEITRQKDLFIQHIKLAEELGLPLMIHARPHVNSQDAYIDTIRILEEQKFTRHANFHFFVGNLEIAQKIVEKGWSVSYDGPITFSNDYDGVISTISIDNIMAETDAPFAAPVPYRGQTNYPYYVEFVYKKIAEIRGLEPEIVRKKLIENANKVFNLDLDKR